MENENNFAENETAIEEPIEVFIRLNNKNEIVEINSSVFLIDKAGWIKIDEGYGDKFAHAQSQYFDKPLIYGNGNHNYQYINGQVVDLTE